MLIEIIHAPNCDQDIQRLVKLKLVVHSSFSMSWFKAKLPDVIGKEVVVVAGAADVVVALAVVVVGTAVEVLGTVTRASSAFTNLTPRLEAYLTQGNNF